MHNGLHTIPSRRVFRGAAGGYQPAWVRSPVLQQVSESEYGADNPVSQGLSRFDKLVGQPSTLTSAFVVMRVRNCRRGARRYLWGTYPSTASGPLAEGFSVSGGPRFGRPISTVGVTSGTGTRVSPGVFNPPPQWFSGDYVGRWTDRELIFAYSMDGTTGEQRGALFQYGWQNQIGFDDASGGGDLDKVAPTANMAFSSAADMYWHVAGFNYGLDGEIAYIWCHLADDDSAWVDVWSDSVQRDLMGNPEGWTFDTPQIWFQGDAAEWNSGVNRGSGGDFVSAGNITDVLRTH